MNNHERTKNESTTHLVDVKSGSIDWENTLSYPPVVRKNNNSLF